VQVPRTEAHNRFMAFQGLSVEPEDGNLFTWKGSVQAAVSFSNSLHSSRPSQFITVR
jgi:hypothetical protein